MQIRKRTGALAFVLGTVVLLAALAGCGTQGSGDPLLAARVDGHTITVADYQMLTGVFKASAESQGQSGAWQTPQGRAGLKQIEQNALDYLINLQLMRDELSKEHLTVTPQLLQQARSSLSQQLDAAHQRLQQNPSDTQTKALLDALTPHAIDLLVEQSADEETLIQHAQIPIADVSAIPVQSQATAQALEQQAEHGANFATLAKNNSTDSGLAAQGGAIGTVYIGQLGNQFDTAVFASAHPAKYLVLPFNGQYVLFKINSLSTKTLASISDTQAQQTSFDAWLTETVRGRAHVERYVTIG